ncbi:MAG: AsmA family protein [Candidatus Tectomicrobia bacterium]|uniref:AsmA family protein n=1 Tax=Tectimicrobiota bacterium TaxID=2528274 RepID=A0A932HZC1_UNCTE|nr:AsmA family protein [Candidatus Tectomicrobia bacterium]
MRTAAIFLGAIAGIIVLAVAGAFIYIKTLDPNQYKGYIAGKAKEATGRDLRIEGPIRFELGLRPVLVVEGASFSNTSWGSRPQMATLKRLEVEVEILPLIRAREIRLKRLVLIHPDILLERNKEGRGNWQFGTADEKQPQKDEKQPQKKEGRGVPAGLALATQVENASVTYRNHQTGKVHRVTIERMSANAESLDSLVALKFKGAYEEIPVTVDGKVGPFGTVLKGTGPFPVEVSFSVGEIQSSVKGRIGDIGDMSGIDLHFASEGGGFSSVKSLVGSMIGGTGKFRLAAQVKGDTASLAITGMTLRSGESDIAGRFKANFKGPRPRFEGELVSKRLLLTEFIQPAKGGQAPKQAPKKEPGAGKGELFPKTPIPYDSLRHVDARVRLSAGELIAPRAYFHEVSADLNLQDGRLGLTALKAKTAGGSMEGNLHANANTKVGGLKVTGRNLEMAELLKNAGTSAWVSGRTDFSLDLQGRGEDVDTLMGNLDGETRLLVGEGTMNTAGLDYLVGGFTQVLGTLLSQGTTNMKLNCAAADFAVKKGVAETRALVADSQFSTISGEGKIDLGRETVDMRVVPKAKSVTLSMSVPVRIEGPLRKPSVRPDELAVARRLAGVIGAFVFPPAAIIGLGELGTWSNPCIDIMKSGAAPGAPKDGDPKDGDPKKGLEGVGKELKKGIEGIGEGLKGLLGK